MSVAARRSRLRREREAAEATRTQEAAAREALGLPAISSELNALYDQLVQRAGSGFEEPRGRTGLSRLGIGGRRPSLGEQINEMNNRVRTDAGLTPAQPQRENRGMEWRFGLGASARNNRRINEEVATVPGLGTALSTLNTAIGEQTETRRTNPDRTTGQRTPFQSGGGTVTRNISGALDRVNQLITGTPFANAETSGGRGASGFINREINRADQRRGEIQDAANFRGTLVSNSAAAQRDVRALNQAVGQGRRRRRGAGVQIPQLALAGLSQQRSRLLG